MKDEFIIINKTVIQKRIEELEEEYNSESAYQFNNYGDKLIKEIMILKQILSQSTPLISQIENAYDAGMLDKEFRLMFDNPKSRYINTLKLDI